MYVLDLSSTRSNWYFMQETIKAYDSVFNLFVCVYILAPDRFRINIVVGNPDKILVYQIMRSSFVTALVALSSSLKSLFSASFMAFALPCGYIRNASFFI